MLLAARLCPDHEQIGEFGQERSGNMTQWKPCMVGMVDIVNNEKEWHEWEKEFEHSGQKPVRRHVGRFLGEEGRNEDGRCGSHYLYPGILLREQTGVSPHLLHIRVC